MSSIKRKAASQIAGSDPKKAKQNTSITSFFGAPKSTTAAAAVGTSPAAAEPAVKFDKAKWVAGLTAEQKDLLQLEIDTLDESWLAQLKAEVVTKEFLDLKRFLNKEASAGKKIFPPREDIYSWCDLTFIYGFSLSPLIAIQVSSHSFSQRQSRHHWPGSLSQRQPGPRSGLLRQAAYERTAIPQEHVQGS